MDIETTLDPDFSDPAAEPTPWATATAALEAAKTYFLVTVRPDGRPHATTVAGVWLDGAFHFVTGPSERKAQEPRRAATSVCSSRPGAIAGTGWTSSSKARRCVSPTPIGSVGSPTP